MSTAPEILLEDVHKKYFTDFKRKTKDALTGLTFQVEQAEVFGIIGPNGAGKSTALKVLMGFVSHDKGTVSLSGHPPRDPRAHKALGYLPENPCLYDHLSIREHLVFCGRTSGMTPEKIGKRIDDILETVDLAHSAKAPIRSYSKGMTQRAALAFALFHQPEILILDEPMSGLDPLGRGLVVDIIKEYNQKGHTILFCSHVLTDVERICDRIGIMNKGRLAAVISPDELRNRQVPQDRRAVSPLESLFMETIRENAISE